MESIHRLRRVRQNLASVVNHNVLGLCGEDYTALKLEEIGLIVHRAMYGSKQGDLKAIDPRTGEMLRVEVKTARQNSKGWYWFRLYKKNHTDCKCTDYVVLNAVSASGSVTSFIVPTKNIRVAHAICIKGRPYTYTGKYAKFRQSDIWQLGDQIYD